jgi:nucleotide-binding universal stress UspA family protein
MVLGMELLVGITNDDTGDALALAEDVARSGQMSLVLCHVHPQPWRVPGPGRIDAEWAAFLKEQAKEAIAVALSKAAPDGPPTRTHIHGHGSSGRGLAEVAEELGTAAIVIGSAPGGRSGAIQGGSTSDQLLHGSPVPVLVATTGYAASRTLPSRVSVAYQETLSTDEAVTAAVQLAKRLRLPMRLVTLIRRPASRFQGAQRALDDLRRDAKEWLEQARARVEPGVVCTAEISEGEDVTSAVQAASWEAGELLVVGSSSAGPIQRVFLGDTSVKIMRASPVPAWFVPRGVEPALESTGVIPVVR